jgi:hypothetical protein
MQAALPSPYQSAQVTIVQRTGFRPLDQNQDDPDSREDTSDTISITLSLRPDLGSMRAGEIYFRPLKLNPSRGKNHYKTLGVHGLNLITKIL